MKNNKYEINLNDYRKSGSYLFSNRFRGEEVRKLSEIDKIEPNYDNIIINIPDDILSVNPSFLEPFIKNVVLKLGEEGFRKKFTFKNNGIYKIDKDLNNTIERISDYSNLLKISDSKHKINEISNDDIIFKKKLRFKNSNKKNKIFKKDSLTNHAFSFSKIYHFFSLSNIKNLFIGHKSKDPVTV